MAQSSLQGDIIIEETTSKLIEENRMEQDPVIVAIAPDKIFKVDNFIVDMQNDEPDEKPASPLSQEDAAPT